MSEKRRDNKNRILRIGEQQRADGRYLFSTIDPITKKRKFVYSWKLERHDKMPEGKKPDLSLREKEKLLERDLTNGISLSGGDMTVLELVEKYLEQNLSSATSKDNTTCVPSYILYECGKARNICRNIEIFNGTYRYKCYLKCVYTP